MRPISELIIHCTATRHDWWKGKKSSEKVAEIKRWHVEDNGWADIGYHYVIDRDGTVTKGRPIERIGAHVKGHNTGSVGISLMGGFGSSASGFFAENFTPDQDLALRRLIADLELQFGKMKLSGHNEYANKSCPGFQVSRWYNRQAPKTKLKSKTLNSSVLLAIAGKAGIVVAALAELDPIVQAVIFGLSGIIVILAIIIFRERLKKAF